MEALFTVARFCAQRSELGVAEHWYDTTALDDLLGVDTGWLFIGHPEAGDRSAIIYSVIGSCRRHGIDPLIYLRDVLTRLPSMTNHDDVTPLLPSNWAATASAAKK